MKKRKMRVIWAVEGGSLPIMCKDGIAFACCWRTKKQAKMLGCGGKPVKFIEDDRGQK